MKCGLEKNIFEIPPCAHRVILITEFALLIKTPHFYEVWYFVNKIALTHCEKKLFYENFF